VAEQKDLDNKLTKKVLQIFRVSKVNRSSLYLNIKLLLFILIVSCKRENKVAPRVFVPQLDLNVADVQ
jgi:hypothetical protein